MPTPLPDNPVRIIHAHLDDDGIIDPVAVDIAARGVRPVELTETEQVHAAVLMLRRGAARPLVAYRLRLGAGTVRRLAAALELAASLHDDPAALRAVA